MYKLIAILILIFSIVFQVNGQQFNSNFIINGKITNRNEGFIVIKYINSKNASITDTAKINQGKFFFKGFIAEPTLAYIIGNAKTSSIDDVNFTDLYIEPKKMDILISENEFKFLKVKGSKTQDEIQVLKDLQKPIQIQLIPLNKKFSELRKAYSEGDKSEQNKTALANTRKEILEFVNQIEKTNFEFVLKNPNSYASAILLGARLDLNSLPIDSAKYYYQSLNAEVQSSYWGKKVFQNLQAKENSTLGKIAPSFKLKDINGKEIALADYKNKKYVLLDFWASWCLPCRESTPAIKLLYEKYQKLGLEIISVSIDDKEKSWRAAVAKDEIPWRNILVGSKSDPNSLKTLYNVVPVPDYILIDKEGKIIGRPLSIKDLNDNNSLTKLLENIFQ